MNKSTRLALAAAVLLVIIAVGAFMWWQRQRLPIVDVSIQSASLTSFWHRPTDMRARVLLPDSYWNSPQRRYPAVYEIHALGTSYLVGRRTTRAWQKAIARSGTDFIVVFLDAAMPAGEHHVFADSANNGPWASALVNDVIPELEKQFRIQATPASRFLAGHSSGGWAALWLQVNYPRFFGGEWSSAPDPVDFHDFIGMNLVRAPLPNAYRN
nr:esterase family protein [Candidatus Eremiobacteraeota bacterium]